jgi:endonuclease/exonuclease/phosphatase family metal-dependent hydrolase
VTSSTSAPARVNPAASSWSYCGVKAEGSQRTTRTATYTRTPGAVLIRSWNVYHGRSYPPGRRGYVETAIRLASADRPDVLCLQELPLWSLARLGRWSSMRPFAARTLRAPFGARAGRALTATHYGVFRSAFSGQANAILIACEHDAENLGSIRISDRRNHPRVCQAVRVDGRIVVANIHASGPVAQTEVDRALAWLDSRVGPGEPLVLAGDFNASLELPGFSAPHGGIDDIFVRGGGATPLRVWPEERRRQNGVVLSDHAPVELTVR